MSRYIDAEKFKHIINNSKMYGTMDWHDVLEMLFEVPTADVVEVVRCKDCIHHKPFPFSDEHICDVFDWKSEDKDFCSFAERRTE